MLPIVIAEFYLHLKEGSTETSITDPSTSKAVKVNLVEVARIFNLFNEGPNPKSARVEIESEFKRFTEEPDDIWRTGLNALRQTLHSMFHLFAQLFTKTMASHIGGHSRISKVKIWAVSVFGDAVEGVKYNLEI